MELGGDGRGSWLTPAVLTLFITSIALGSLEFSVIGIQTELAEYFGKSVADIGLLVTVFALGIVIGTPVVLMLTTKIDRFRIMVVSLIGLIVLTFLSALMDSYEIMILNRFVSAFLSGATISCSYVLCTELPAPENRAKSMTLAFAGYSVSSVFIIPILETIAHVTSWHFSYVLVIGLQITSLVMILLFIPKNAAPWVGNRRDEIGLFKDRRIIIALIAPLFAVGAVYMVYSYITTIFVQGYGIYEDYLYLFLFVFGLTTIVSNVLSAYVESHGGLAKMKYVFAIQVFILVLVSIALFTTKNDLWLIGVNVMMLVGLIMCVINTPLQSYYIRLAKNDYPGGVNLSACFQSIAFNMGVAVGSVLGGAVFHNGMMNYVGFIAAGVTVIAIILMVYLERISDGKYMSP